MSSAASHPWADRSTVRLDRQDPYLSLQHVTIQVRDLDRSLRFYVDQLGFSLTYDVRLESGDRWVAVTPPDGTAMLALVAPKADSEDYKLIGQSKHIAFLTEDVAAKFNDWRNRGVRFRHPPMTPEWGGTFTSFEDLDGNSFALVGFDDATRQVEARRRAAAEKLEAEHRAAQELEIARQVQARLFPQALPALRTLDYAGTCIQARQVGGDYYDFLDLGRERLGMVIADISGKGIGAALLMANLQANLRSHCAIALDQPQRLLRTVNQLFCENTTARLGEWAPSAYATLFFADDDDKLGRLRYANCGHLSGLLLRSDHSLERLDSTSSAVGLFAEWDCSMAERSLFTGDTLALYTDGVTEAFNDAGEEFGEGRLIDALQRHRELPSETLLATIVDEVQRFSPQEQHDDITLIVAKCRRA